MKSKNQDESLMAIYEAIRQQTFDYSKVLRERLPESVERDLHFSKWCHSALGTEEWARIDSEER